MPRLRRVDLQLLPQVADVDRHGVVRAEGLFLPHGGVDLLGGEHRAGGGQEKLEYLVFLGGEGHRLPVQQHLLGAVVQADAPGSQGLARFRRALIAEIAPQLAADPGADLQGLEGLGHIVVRPQVQAQDLVRILAFGGEEDDGGAAALPKGGQGAQPVHHRHHDVQQDEVHFFPVQDLQGLLPVAGGEDMVVRLGEIDLQRGDDVRVVVTDQDVGHVRSPFSLQPYSTPLPIKRK